MINRETHVAKPGSGVPSRGGSVIVIQQSPEPLTRQNALVAGSTRRRWHDQLIAQTLMIPFAMIVLDELGDGSPEGSFSDVNQPVEAGFLLKDTLWDG